MKRAIVCLFLFFSLPSQIALGQFSTDAPILLKMLANAVVQLTQLYKVVETSRENLSIAREIHQGLSEAINLGRELDFKQFDPKLYRDWQDGQATLAKLQERFGPIEPSQFSGVQTDLDTAAAEAIVVNNGALNHGERLRSIGERVAGRAPSSSQKGAQRLTAQGVGALVSGVSESVRTEAMQLRLSAQQVAAENHREKTQIRHLRDSVKELRSEMEKPQHFSLPKL